ncbi:hypothetical protein BC829DRAFT_445185 [Chytridium lagenaria]|nr:hypothetical protein BC829DRAFT_445185 [Chytridium lagenaria]
MSSTTAYSTTPLPDTKGFEFAFNLLSRCLAELHRLCLESSTVQGCDRVAVVLCEYVEKFEQIKVDKRTVDYGTWSPGRERGESPLGSPGRGFGGLCNDRNLDSWEHLQLQVHLEHQKYQRVTPRNLYDLSASGPDPYFAHTSVRRFVRDEEFGMALGGIGGGGGAGRTGNGNGSVFGYVREGRVESPSDEMVTRVTRKRTLSWGICQSQENRDTYLTDKTAKLRHKSEKAQTIKMLQQEQNKILRESIEEKHAKAEKLREMYLKSIQDKAKEESQKLDEVAFVSALNIEARKHEVAQRHLDSEARRQEMEEERQRRLSGTAALQEAATGRRRQQESQRLSKLAREEERKRELEERRERGRGRRVAEAKSINTAKDEEMGRAAAANQNAREVALRGLEAQAARRTPDLGEERGRPVFMGVLRVGQVSRIVVPREERLRETSATYSYIPRSLHPSDGPKTQLRIDLDQLTTLVGRVVVTNATDGELGMLDGMMEKVAGMLEGGREEDLSLMCTTGALDAMVRLGLEGVEGRGRVWYSTIQRGIHLLLLSLQSESNREHLLASPDALSFDLAELLVRLLPAILVSGTTEATRRLSNEGLVVVASVMDLNETACEVYGGRGGGDGESSGGFDRSVSTALQKCDLPGVLVSMLAALVLAPSRHAGGMVVAGSLGGRGLWNISVRGVRVLNLMCALDLGMVQTVLASEAIQFLFFHLAVHWIQGWSVMARETSQCEASATVTASCLDQPDKPVSVDEETKQGEPEVSRMIHTEEDHRRTLFSRHTLLFHELLLLLGHACLDSPANRSHSTMLVGVLPFRYFCWRSLREVVFPMVVVGCLGETGNVAVVGEEMDPMMVVGWLRGDEEGRGWEGGLRRRRKGSGDGGGGGEEEEEDEEDGEEECFLGDVGDDVEEAREVGCLPLRKRVRLQMRLSSERWEEAAAEIERAVEMLLGK